MYPPTRLPRVALCLSLLLCVPAAGQQPLHERIDALIAAGTPNFDKLAAPLADDAEFLRRVFIDLTGTVPTVEQARAFLADASSDKRTKLIDTLLASPEYARHMAQVFDVMLMERRAGKAVAADAWREYLRASFLANKPWDVLAREILTDDGADAKTRPAARFILDRGEPHVLTRDVGRLFLGMDFQCAQCHDHPLIDDYKQDMYYGIFAFLNRTSVVTDAKLKLIVLSEKADGEATFQSVFDPAKVTKTALPRVLDRPPLKDPALKKGEEYVVKPDKTVRGVPKYSRRALLGGEVARPDSEAFRSNIANRLWAHLMGIGIINPVDLSHSANPPSHPELLKLLSDELAARKFDMRWLLRELVLTKTYQRSSRPPAGAEVSPSHFASANLKPLTPEVLAFSLYEATGNTDVERAALAKGLTEAALYPRVARAVAPMVKTFEGEAGMPEEFQPTLDQALFLSNSPVLKGWLAARGNNLTARLAKLKPEEAVEEVYLSILTRRPTDEEEADVLAYLKTGPGAMQDVVWALLTSAEFRFNH